MSKSKTAFYKLLNADNGAVLSENVATDDVEALKGMFEDIGYNVAVNEEAAGGSTGAGSIAVNMGGNGTSSMPTLKKFIADFQKKVKKNNPKPFYITVTEAFDMESVFSRLSGMEKAGSPKKTEGTTFGVEDDDGNIMKVTVRSDQADDFEQEVAKHLADIKLNVQGQPNPRGATDVSMAELLFKMKDKFDIIDVEFPKIPTDVVYNADKASYGAPTDTGAEMGEVPPGDEFGMGGEDDLSQPLDLTDFEDKGEGEEGDTLGADMDLDAEMGDADGVEDFEEPDMDQDEGSILTKVIDMLKAQAEAETEKAKADAEKAKADQARYTAQATAQAVQNQEEALRYELEMEEAKKREKEAQKMADMAKHKMSKTMSFTSQVGESVEGDTPAIVMRQRQAIMQLHQILPTDSPETRAYKSQQRMEAMREWQSRYRQAVNKARFDAKNARTADDVAKQQAQAQKNPQNPQNAQNAQVPQGQPQGRMGNTQ